MYLIPLMYLVVSTVWFNLTLFFIRMTTTNGGKNEFVPSQIRCSLHEINLT